jgi:hypothetical protein
MGGFKEQLLCTCAVSCDAVALLLFGNSPFLRFWASTSDLAPSRLNLHPEKTTGFE